MRTIRKLAVGALLLAWALAHAGGPGTLDAWIELEQKRIDRTVDPARLRSPDVQHQNLKFRPESREWFDLNSVWIPESELEIASLERLIPPELRSELIRTRNGVQEYRLFVHPESEKFYAPLIERYGAETLHQATSTGSSRSVLVRSKSDPSKNYIVKLSLDVELAGVVRTIPRGEVARGVGTTAYLLSDARNTAGAFKIMPEVLGILPKGWTRGGQIIRLIPPEVLEGRTRLVPMFSLYAKTEEGALLEKLAARSGLSPRAFVEEKILKPFFEGWADWAVRGSVVMEAHAQNFLMELDAEGKPTGKFVHRDMGGFNIDSDSPLFGKGARRSLPRFTRFSVDYHQRFSTSAKRQSVFTYFEGGVLYNLDRELVRIDPGYKKGEIYTASRRAMVDALARVGGAAEPAVEVSNVAKLERGLPARIRRAQRAYLKRTEAPRCLRDVLHRLLGGG